jgi:hypothetical protein
MRNRAGIETNCDVLYTRLMKTKFLASNTPAFGAKLTEIKINALMTLTNGDPHLISYKPAGTTILNRFNGDCLGNRTEKSSEGDAYRSFNIGRDALVLFA